MNTLLEDFIIRKRNQHKEPTRTKVPRGQKIGISKARHEAALIVALCNFDLKGVADHVQGSYEVIRRWKSDENFKGLCEAIAKEFYWNISLELQAIMAEKKALNTQNAGFDNDYSIFRDVAMYREEIIAHLLNELGTYLASNDGYHFFDVTRAIAEFSGCHQFYALLIRAQESSRDHIDTANATRSPENLSQKRKENLHAT